MKTYTPELIESLKPNEVFVFGSNLNGEHIGGAARIAFNMFGAEWGKAEGLSGQSYAIPTLDKNMKKVSELSLLFSFSNFIMNCFYDRTKVFYLTKVGCGIAGWEEKEVKRIFWKSIFEYFDILAVNNSNSLISLLPKNLIIPKEFDNPETQTPMEKVHELVSKMNETKDDREKNQKYKNDLKNLMNFIRFYDFECLEKADQYIQENLKIW